MKKIQDGYQNEFLIVLEFNNKMIKELNPLLREVIDDLFPNCDEESIIKAWRNHSSVEKGDILIKINGIIKTISIKMGSKNSVHVESLKIFKYFLSCNGIDESVIARYVDFHYGVDRSCQGKILTSSEYCFQNEDDIKIINNGFSKLNIDSVLDRFLFKGNVDSIYSVDGIIYGTPNDFFWINKNQIKKIISDSLDLESKSVHYGCLFIQPFNRCINNNYKHKWKRDYVQIKWYSLFDDIIKYKNRVLEETSI